MIYDAGEKNMNQMSSMIYVVLLTRVVKMISMMNMNKIVLKRMIYDSDDKSDKSA